MRRRAVLGLLFLIALSLMQAACAQSFHRAGTRPESEHRSGSDFTAETDNCVMTLDVRTAMTSVDLDVRITLSAGSASLKLTDPSGEARWEEEIVAPAGYRKSRDFEAINGEWTLEVSLEDATGGYDIRWQGSN